MEIPDAINAAARLLGAVQTIRALAALLVLAIVLLAWILFRNPESSLPTRLVVFLIPIGFFGALFLETVVVLTPNVIRLSPQSLVIASAIGPDEKALNLSQLQWAQCYQPPRGYVVVHGKLGALPGVDTLGGPRSCGAGTFGHRCKDTGYRCWNRYASSICFVRKAWLRRYTKERGAGYSAAKLCDLGT